MENVTNLRTAQEAPSVLLSSNPEFREHDLQTKTAIPFNFDLKTAKGEFSDCSTASSIKSSRRSIKKMARKHKNKRKNQAERAQDAVSSTRNVVDDENKESSDVMTAEEISSVKTALTPRKQKSKLPIPSPFNRNINSEGSPASVTGTDESGCVEAISRRSRIPIIITRSHPKTPDLTNCSNSDNSTFVTSREGEVSCEMDGESPCPSSRTPSASMVTDDRKTMHGVPSLLFVEGSQSSEYSSQYNSCTAGGTTTAASVNESVIVVTTIPGQEAPLEFGVRTFINGQELITKVVHIGRESETA